MRPDSHIAPDRPSRSAPERAREPSARSERYRVMTVLVSEEAAGVQGA